jgi:hypothetical protein
LLIKHKFWITAPGAKEAIFESASSNALQVDSRDYLIGIYVAAAKRNSGACVLDEFFH